MPVDFQVQARVVDLRSDTPKSSDAYLVDTNVWFWMCYSRASLLPHVGLLDQLITYPPYLKRVLEAKAKVYRCGLSFAELTHQIETAEREIYEQRSQLQLKPKEFRHNYPAERAKVVGEVNTAWDQVKRLAEPVDVQINDPVTDAALTRFQSQPVDGYDLFILEALSSVGIIQVLSDDGDFCTVPGIMLFTANHRVLEAASRQGKIIQR